MVLVDERTDSFFSQHSKHCGSDFGKYPTLQHVDKSERTFFHSRAYEGDDEAREKDDYAYYAYIPISHMQPQAND